ncbi:MAG: D-glycerate dehydrogenase [Sutterellaceae bacterium]|nr:D-glycerate dehydrogenase [Burkholderiaceae bacterium]MCX7901402.1 D-glycerate dehydrogenase [Burkholderiaceae bacterium]MDW8429139.1 D-glycerate dehydrogenase [Sutterellaceae bacterium]
MSENRLRVAVTRRIFPELIDFLRARYEVRDNQADAPLSPQALREHLRDADGVLATGGDRIDAALLEACPRLKVVSNIAVGYNNIDLDACTAYGVAATNTPDVLNEATADHAWALLLAAARRVGEAERFVRAGQWKRWEFEMLMGADLYGRTLGIVGMGRIGRAIARRAQGFAMRVLYHNRKPLPSELAGAAEYRSLEVLLAEADHVIVVVPYSPQTHHLIGARELARMKPSAVLVNIARGGVVDDAALVEALRARRLFAAGLDVFENEPALNPAFLALDNVVLTPHIASSTRATRQAMADLAIRNLEDVLAGRRPAALLNAEVWDRRRR